MPQTPKKQKDIYPKSHAPVKINQRTGDVAPGESKFLTRGAERRTLDVVQRTTEAGKTAKYEGKMPNYRNFSDVAKLAKSEAYLDEINPLRKIKLDAETVQKDLVRANRATALPKVNIPEMATKAAAGAGAIASGLAKTGGVLGVAALARKAAGEPPKQEEETVNAWNKRTNYGRIQGPISKALGVINK
jgi:hypothetical protein